MTGPSPAIAGASPAAGSPGCWPGAAALVGGTLLGWNATLLTADRDAAAGSSARSSSACPPWRRCGACVQAVRRLEVGRERPSGEL